MSAHLPNPNAPNGTPPLPCATKLKPSQAQLSALPAATASCSTGAAKLKLATLTVSFALLAALSWMGCDARPVSKPVAKTNQLVAIYRQTPALPNEQPEAEKLVVMQRPPNLGRYDTRTNVPLWWEQRWGDGALIQLPLTKDGKLVLYSVEQRDSLASPWRVLTVTSRPPVMIRTVNQQAQFRVGRIP